MLNRIHIFIVTGSFLYWCVMKPTSQHFFIHSCIYILILIISYLATFLGTNSFSVLMCRKAVNQAINQSIVCLSFCLASCTYYSVLVLTIILVPLPLPVNENLLISFYFYSSLSKIILQLIILGTNSRYSADVPLSNKQTKLRLAICL